MRVLASFLGLAALLVIALPILAVDESDKLFDEVFGPKVEAAKRSISKADDLEVADELFSAASEVADEPALLKKILMTVHELASSTSKGYETALMALDALEKVPGANVEAIDLRIVLRRKMLRSVKRSERAEMSESVIDDLLSLAAIKSDSDDLPQAMLHVRSAQAMATSIRSDRREEIKERLALLQARKMIFNRVDLLKKRLKANNKDQKAVQDLVLIYLVDLNRPDEARKYGFLIADEKLKNVVRLSVVESSERSAEDVLVLGDFYNALGGKPSTGNKPSAFRQALALYKQHQALAPNAKGLVSAKVKISIGNIEKWLAARGEPLTAVASSGSGRSALSGKLPAGKWVDISPYMIAMATDLDIPLPIKNSVRKGDSVRIAFTKLWVSHRFQIGVLPEAGYRYQVSFGSEGDYFRTRVRLPVGKYHHAMVDLDSSGIQISIPGSNDPGSRFPKPLAAGKKYLAEFRVTPQGGQYRIQVAINNKSVLDWVTVAGSLRRTMGLNLFEFELGRNSTASSSPIVFSKPKIYVTSGDAIAKTFEADIEARIKSAPGVYHLREVYVSPTTPWTIAGKIVAGKTYNLKSSYYWQTKPRGPEIGPFGDEAGRYHLQAKIGKDGKAVDFGKIKTFTAPKSGVLYFGMATEKTEDMWDNGTYLRVRIRQNDAPPAPAGQLQTVLWRPATRPVPANVRWTAVGKLKAGARYEVGASQPSRSGVYGGTKVPGKSGVLSPLGLNGKYVLMGRINKGEPFPIWTGKSSAARVKHISVEKDGVLELGITDSNSKLTGYFNTSVRAVDMVSHIRRLRSYQVRQYFYYKRNAD